MNKKAILLLGIVVVCVVVIAVMNFLINVQESKESVQRVDRKVVGSSVKQPAAQEQPTFPVEEKEPQPEYEATVSNGTILF